MPTAELAYLALGSNLGDRARFLAFARQALAALPATTVIAATDVEETAPIGQVPQGPFLNQMLLIRTALDPWELLTHCLAIESEAGRRRGEPWGPRTLDIDLVRFGRRSVSEPGLTIPHPELPQRPFWMRELRELERHVH